MNNINLRQVPLYPRSAVPQDTYDEEEVKETEREMEFEEDNNFQEFTLEDDL